MYFLAQIAKYVYKNCLHETDKLTIVFPSRRAGLFFKQELAKILTTHNHAALFMPQTKVIDEFFTSKSDRLIPDDLDLIYLLYKCYIKVYYSDDKSEIIPFDEFYPFGEMVLKDFQEIDNYLVEPKQIFADLNLLEKIKEGDMETFMQFEAVKRFVRNFSQLSESEPKERFGFFWNRLFFLYEEFQQQLKAKNWAYSANIFRNLITEKSFLHDKEKVFFAGFNALTKSEEQLINIYLKEKNAKIFWKYDDVFLGNQNNEGSRFLNYYMKRWANNVNSIVVKNPNAVNHKNLNIYNSASSIAQIKRVAHELKTVPEGEVNNTLVVLSDENLLQPFLNSVPSNIEKVNVTMGFSVRNTGFYSLLNSLFSLIEKTKGEKIYHQFLRLFLAELKSLNQLEHEVDEMVDWLEDNGEIYVAKPYLSEHQNTLNCFLNKAVFEESIDDFIVELIAFMDSLFAINKNSTNAIAWESFKKELIKTQRIILADNELFNLLDKSFLIRLLRQIAIGIKVPFEGEPAEGLQVMGPLEIRVLDFNRVFMVSMNDGVYPQNSVRTSLLPFGLRKAFFLPTFETQESIYAHHFYALFQSANTINCYYSTREGGVGASEKSRFLTQLLYEKLDYPSLNMNEYNLSYSTHAEYHEKEAFNHTSYSLQNFINKYVASDKYISPTALGTYFECEAKFYFRYIQNMYEKDEITEEMESVDIGNLIHKTLELMFQSKDNIEVSDINNYIKNVDTFVQKAIEEYSFKNADKGYNFYLIDATKGYLKIYLNQLKDISPFKVIATEKEVLKKIRFGDIEVNLGGNIDLIIEHDNVQTVIDFKTGRKETYTPKGEVIDLIFDNQRKYKHYFQLLYYLYLIGNQHDEIDAELHYILKKSKVKIEDNVKMNQIEQMEQKILTILPELFNEEKKFIKTLDKENCLNCQFKQICNR